MLEKFFVKRKKSVKRDTFLRAIGCGLFHLIRYLGIGISQRRNVFPFFEDKDFRADLNTGTASVAFIPVYNDGPLHTFPLFEGIFFKVPVRLHRVHSIKTGKAKGICRKPGCLH